MVGFVFEGCFGWGVGVGECDGGGGIGCEKEDFDGCGVVFVSE